MAYQAFDSGLGSRPFDEGFWSSSVMQAYIPLILFVVATNALSQTLLKQGMVGIGAFTLNPGNALSMAGRVALDPFVIAGMTLMIISMASHLYVLSRVPLTFAFPFISISYIVILGVGYFFFDEKLNFYHYLGTAFIAIGVFCIAQAGAAVRR
jgi:drug/metabolite transporter (DMT)-like permease